MNDNILDQELGWEDEIENEGSPRRVPVYRTGL